MPLGPSELLFLPLAAFALAGLAFYLAFRRAGAAWALRLGAIFLALWAILATTGLVWLVTRGGVFGLSALVHNPLLLFAPSAAFIWLAGALGALAVFGLAFAVNQTVGRGLLRLLATRALPWPKSLPQPPEAVRLLAFESPESEAFSFTLLRRAPRRILGVAREELILISESLWTRLSDRERTAVVAHELGHVRGFDGRYLTFVRTLSRLVRWDPLVALVSNGLTRREEFRADEDAVRMTGDPEALARALFKVVTVATPADADGARHTGQRATFRPGQVRERIARLASDPAHSNRCRLSDRSTME